MLLLVPFCCRVHAEEDGKEKSDLSPAQIEKRFHEVMNDGKQSEAEKLLARYVPAYRDNQDVVFLYAACVRSRFMIREAFPVFAAVVELGKDTPRGQCAAYVMRLDTRRDVNKNFDALDKLVEANRDDVVLRWMIAVECRTLDRKLEGIAHYKEILKKWNPGPSLVHQTYGNLLSESGRYEEALVERRITVKLEPAGWSYQGLGNTLASMKRFDEANAAYQKSVELDPKGSDNWRAWAWGLLRQRDFKAAITKAEKAIALDPKNFDAWDIWGECLERMGDKRGALDKYEKALEINPSGRFSLSRVIALRKELGVEVSSPPARQDREQDRNRE